MGRQVVRMVVGASTLALVGAGCGADDGPQDGQLSVVATVGHVADFVRVIGGDQVHVTQLLSANVDPHDFEPDPADLKDLHDADVLVRNGVGLEAWLTDAVDGSGFDGRLVDASSGVTLRDADGGDEHHHDHGDAHEGHEHGPDDPHIWHDPHNAQAMVETIADALVEADPDGAPGYRSRLTDYQAELDALDQYVTDAVATIPADQRKLVTNHDSLGYYASRYDLEYVGSVLPSFSSSAELSTDDIDSLVARIEQTDVPAVFAESALPKDAARTIAEEAGVEVVSGEDALYTDTLGPEGSPAATYLDMMRHNTDVIVDALS